MVHLFHNFSFIGLVAVQKRVNIAGPRPSLGGSACKASPRLPFGNMIPYSSETKGWSTLPRLHNVIMLTTNLLWESIAVACVRQRVPV